MRWLAIVLFACSCGSPRISTQPVAGPASTGPSARASELARPLRPADPLERGKDVERTIKSGDTHRFRIQLQTGQVALGAVMQDGIDLALTTFDATGKKVAEFDSPNGTQGPEPFVIEATKAGAYV